MKLTTHLISAPLHTPFVTALRTATHADSLLVEVSDGSLSGWGEAPQVWKVTGESLAGAQACVEGPIATALDGLGPTTSPRRCGECRAPRRATSGRRRRWTSRCTTWPPGGAGRPCTASSARRSTTVRTDVTLSAGDPDALADGREGDRIADGFDVLKVKVGTGDADADFAPRTPGPRGDRARAAAAPRCEPGLEPSRRGDRDPRAGGRRLRPRTGRATGRRGRSRGDGLDHRPGQYADPRRRVRVRRTRPGGGDPARRGRPGQREARQVRRTRRRPGRCWSSPASTASARSSDR